MFCAIETSQLQQRCLKHLSHVREATWNTHIHKKYLQKTRANVRETLDANTKSPQTFHA